MRRYARRWHPLALLGWAAVALPAAAHPSMTMQDAVPAAAEAVSAGEVSVSIDNFTFDPPVLTVAAGTRVVWTNHDDIPHDIVGTEDPRALRSPVLDTDDAFSFTFATPGTYRYFCGLHPHMVGMVVVR